jgi:hypothetical protein
MRTKQQQHCRLLLVLLLLLLAFAAGGNARVSGHHCLCMHGSSRIQHAELLV